MMIFLLIYCSGMVAFLALAFIINGTEDEYMHTPLKVALGFSFLSWIVFAIFGVTAIIRHLPELRMPIPQKWCDFYERKVKKDD